MTKFITTPLRSESINVSIITGLKYDYYFTVNSAVLNYQFANF